ncbi:hypothetical protein [Mycobacterium ulcerans]|uniref:hypothetical protein n=1 Tax=Mycobacterium ulcerans TaxID=1809 RepID=UPI00214C9CE0|nr:hypothetical protein [Mycobacterium ulcerans]
MPKPDTPPGPELKNPDDGLSVALPKPGAVGRSRIGMEMGPMPAPIAVLSEVESLPSERTMGIRLMGRAPALLISRLVSWGIVD